MIKMHQSRVIREITTITACRRLCDGLRPGRAGSRHAGPGHPLMGSEFPPLMFYLPSSQGFLPLLLGQFFPHSLVSWFSLSFPYWVDLSHPYWAFQTPFHYWVVFPSSSLGFIMLLFDLSYGLGFSPFLVPTFLGLFFLLLSVLYELFSIPLFSLLDMFVCLYPWQLRHRDGTPKAINQLI